MLNLLLRTKVGPRVLMVLSLHSTKLVPRLLAPLPRSALLPRALQELVQTLPQLVALGPRAPRTAGRRVPPLATPSVSLVHGPGPPGRLREGITTDYTRARCTSFAVRVVRWAQCPAPSFSCHCGVSVASAIGFACWCWGLELSVAEAPVPAPVLLMLLMC
jgi:hypothetical protein